MEIGEDSGISELTVTGVEIGEDSGISELTVTGVEIGEDSGIPELTVTADGLHRHPADADLATSPGLHLAPAGTPLTTGQQLVTERFSTARLTDGTLPRPVHCAI
ncbi:hypothetical protein [Streptomyces sp. TRM70350]|uniref:hypothetical protein n=1 Tax=Streptomyces sp. TRM70350 TaxID=2856165 RepID=UPI001C46B35A|nr:hypothetical protein [Streptomyces sp. TRM70350]MBV7697354.1 hypothetical protein [Streptomyces sp. TRM70350]